MLVGAQTYTVRDFTKTEADFRQAMQRLAAMGYQRVQLSAVGPMAPRVLRDICDEQGLKIVLTHTPPDRMIEDPEGVIADHQVLGCDYIGVGMMPERYRTAQTVAHFTRDFRPAAEKFAKAGKLLMYHNHHIEWEKVDGDRNMLDVLLEGLPPELMGITLDTYWVQMAGADIVDTIIRLQDRIPCVHLKDMAVKGFETRMAAVGEGNIPFEKILALLKKLNKTRYLLVEQDHSYGEDPFDCLERSLHYLTRQGY